MFINGPQNDAVSRGAQWGIRGGGSTIFSLHQKPFKSNKARSLKYFLEK